MEERNAISISGGRTSFTTNMGLNTSPDHTLILPPKRRIAHYDYEQLFDQLQSTWNAEPILISDHRAITFSCVTEGKVIGGVNYDRGRFAFKYLSKEDRIKINGISAGFLQLLKNQMENTGTSPCESYKSS